DPAGCDRGEPRWQGQDRVAVRGDPVAAAAVPGQPALGRHLPGRGGADRHRGHRRRLRRAGAPPAPGRGADTVTTDGGPAAAATGLIGRLVERGETLAVAESLTGGLLAATIVDVPGASAAFRGGLVVYATDLKASLAGVDEDLLAERGPVDPDVAAALAEGARRCCGA